MYESSSDSFHKIFPLQCNPKHKNRPTLVLKVILANVRSICNKLDIPKAFLDYHRPDILQAVTEPWGRPTLLDSFLSFDDDVLFRQDRCSDRSGGGVFLLVRKVWSSSSFVAPTFDSEQFEDSVWCSIPTNSAQRLLVGCIYRSPSCPLLNDNCLGLLLG